jgi:hypothetical protein
MVVLKSSIGRRVKKEAIKVRNRRSGDRSIMTIKAKMVARVLGDLICQRRL